jgi:hypothetical protein
MTAIPPAASAAEHAEAARREDLTEQIRRAVDAAPPLTEAQRARLALILGAERPVVPGNAAGRTSPGPAAGPRIPDHTSPKAARRDGRRGSGKVNRLDWRAS